MNLGQLVIFNCRKPQDDGPHIHHPAAFVLPGRSRGTHIHSPNSLNVQTGNTYFAILRHRQGLHPGGVME